MKNILTFLLLCASVSLVSCKKDAGIEPQVPVTGIRLKQSNLSMIVGDKQVITPFVKPEEADNKFVSWASGDESVAWVSSEGRVTAVKAGTAVITATTADGGKSATCTVVVKNTLAELLRIIQSGIYFQYDWGSGLTWPWQLTQGLNHDMFSGYFHDRRADFNDKNSVYNLNKNWAAAAWDFTYQYIIPAVMDVEERTQEVDSLLMFYGINKILKVELMHRICDTYGPIAYPRPDTVQAQQDAYKAFFSDLDEGVESLMTYNKSEGSVKDFSTYDMLNCPSTDDWIRFANSLRLRLAMRISNVDKATAAAQVKTALSNPYGVLESNADVVQAEWTGCPNPLYGVAGWDQVYMGATMASVLNGYQDPRLARWFCKATLAGHRDEYLGIPQGVFMQAGDPDYYAGYSKFNMRGGKMTPSILMTPAEIWFLRAEAALRGYTGENVQACYELGVHTSFGQWEAGDATNYLSDNANSPWPYVDYVPKSGGKDMPALITITTKWDNGASNEVKLERIITQKWLACFPESYEAWSEQRRTGYPCLFKVQTNNSGGAINTAEMIRRLPFSEDAAAKDPQQYTELINALRGSDNGGTRLWWDAGGNCF